MLSANCSSIADSAMEQSSAHAPEWRSRWRCPAAGGGLPVVVKKKLDPVGPSDVKNEPDPGLKNEPNDDFKEESNDEPNDEFKQESNDEMIPEDIAYASACSHAYIYHAQPDAFLGC